MGGVAFFGQGEMRGRRNSIGKFVTLARHDHDLGARQGDACFLGSQETKRLSRTSEATNFSRDSSLAAHLLSFHFDAIFLFGPILSLFRSAYKSKRGIRV